MCRPIGEETVTITLEHADAVTVAKSIRELFVQRVVKGKRTETIKIIAYERTNSLIIVAPKAQIDKIYDLLKELDRQVPRGGG